MYIFKLIEPTWEVTKKKKRKIVSFIKGVKIPFILWRAQKHLCCESKPYIWYQKSSNSL